MYAPDVGILYLHLSQGLVYEAAKHFAVAVARRTVRYLDLLVVFSLCKTRTSG